VIIFNIYYFHRQYFIISIFLMLKYSMEDINNQRSDIPPFNPQSPTEINPIPQKNKLPKKVIVLVVLLLLIITTIVVGTVFFKKTTITKINPTETNTNEVDIKANSGWKIYRNDVLGIEFQYPEKWGNLTLAPSENITDLKTINKDFLNLEDNNLLRYMVEIRFSQNPYITFNFINDKYPGYKYPNGFAAKYGPIDNFQKLITTKNICDYHFSFKNDVDGRNVTYLESDNKCEDNIKTTLFFENPDATNQSGDKYFNYQIKQYFYKKLNNGYFDNLLISNDLVSYQGSEIDLDSSQVINKGKTEIPYDLSSSNFKEFVESIKTFTPPIPTPITFSQNSNQDPNIITIYQYYFYLATQKLNDAYEMYLNKNISFDTFTQWYGQVFNTNVYNIQKTGTNIYTFNVDLLESNKSTTKYKVVMEVNNSKINTLSSEQIISDEVKFGNYTAYTRIKSNKNEVVLVKDGKEKVIESADNDYQNKIETTMSFYNPKFSPLGNYLIYDSSGWEWGSPTIYDIIKGQKIKIDLSYANIIFTRDEKNLISCTSDGIGSGVSAMIYSLPTFSLKKDFKNSIDNLGISGVMSANCSYTPEKSEISIIISDGEKQQKTIKYNLDNGQESVQ